MIENKPSLHKNIVLLGMMGSGKSVIGRVLAFRLGFGFLDLDDFIQNQQGKTVLQLFENFGEKGFREIELEALNQIKTIKNHVIACGGGTATVEESWAKFEKIGHTVWIDTPPNELGMRFVMRPDEIRNRPLIADLVQIENRKDRLDALIVRFAEIRSARLKSYEQADIRVSDDCSTPEVCARAIKQALIKMGEVRKSL